MSASSLQLATDGDLNLIATAQFHHEALVSGQEGIEDTQGA
jgi:hypothetical protein